MSGAQGRQARKPAGYLPEERPGQPKRVALLQQAAKKPGDETKENEHASK